MHGYPAGVSARTCWRIPRHSRLGREHELCTRLILHVDGLCCLRQFPSSPWSHSSSAGPPSCPSLPPTSQVSTIWKMQTRDPERGLPWPGRGPPTPAKRSANVDCAVNVLCVLCDAFQSHVNYLLGAAACSVLAGSPALAWHMALEDPKRSIKVQGVLQGWSRMCWAGCWTHSSPA